MLSRRLVRAAGAATLRSALRAFSTTSQQLKVPSMADVSAAPQSVASFNEKSKQFREQLVDQQKRREASAWSQFPPPSSSSSAAESAQDLGSSSGATSGQKAEAQDPPRKPGPLTNLIYGTKEGRELDAQLEASFSQVLARGKYVHSIVFHEVKPDKVDEYTELVGNWYPRMASMPENKVHLVGSWRTEVGDCNTFVHIWEYQRYQGYHESIHSIGSHPQFSEFDKKLKSLIASKKTSLMQEFSFWPTTPPRQLGGVFELRSYTLHPGNLLEWETHWRRGLKARREVMEGVGAWFVQIGDLNTVHHLWQFANLEERKVRREKSWSVEGWSETVHKTVPLIQTMKSRILVPMPWSPVA
ncbi:nipsnap family protein [Colletotrichum musicola]|uniref:Nipsnap family protein n=1 Tax=Colletotrichum musicola TaxID=2175873 RepID=A0A8H6MQ12_9PEZI|nr:nipsnap family protein [Colletotrichum musicola]